MSKVSMRELFEAGAHFGHRTRFWNPKMAPYIYGKRGDIHIINLEQTVPMLNDALNFLGTVVANGGRVMFVGTKRSATESIEKAAKRCGMPYVNFRWLGGMMTNFKTIRQSIRRLEEIEKMSEDGTYEKLAKKEVIVLEREREKLARSLTGIRHMKQLPDVLFVIDVGHEHIAIQEARKLGIPVVGVVDTNGDIDGVDYIIPGNDDSVRAIRLYVEAIADAIEAAKASVTTGGGEDAAAALEEVVVEKEVAAEEAATPAEETAKDGE
ncbi:30S ribosomal protein S2 [Suttonella ornithocola]|uniref:Small ribosomal subunit protein uS2 n=1 Tax=Suttonella ornithocola TaxID=279832 RepID=A0A380MLS4_9GAMM|nr:30S ribosomal protein S2 [Suttonella ornithocola]SUO93124.1 30S ribosomal protein S2 [Suttonella ornithocola]